MWGLVAAGAASALGGKSAKKAAKEQAAALDRATAEQQRQYDQTRADLQPFRDYGQGGITALSDPNANFYASADYAFRRSEGERGIGSSFAARGGAYSGRAMKALADYNQVEYGRATQSGLQVIDFTVDGLQEDRLLDTRPGARTTTAAVFGTFSAGETITIESEVLEPLGVY